MKHMIVSLWKMSHNPQAIWRMTLRLITHMARVSLMKDEPHERRTQRCTMSWRNYDNNNNLVWWHCHRDAPLQNVIQTQKCASHVSLTYQPHPFLHGAFYLTQPHPHSQKRNYGCSLTVMPWTTTDEFNVIPKTQQMSLVSFSGQSIIPRTDVILMKTVA